MTDNEIDLVNEIIELVRENTRLDDKIRWLLDITSKAEEKEATMSCYKSNECVPDDISGAVESKDIRKIFVSSSSAGAKSIIAKHNAEVAGREEKDAEI